MDTPGHLVRGGAKKYKDKAKKAALGTGNKIN
jgi:hypothetical protein